MQIPQLMLRAYSSLTEFSQKPEDAAGERRRNKIKMPKATCFKPL
jgi:hypothetical protein